MNAVHPQVAHAGNGHRPLINCFLPSAECGAGADLSFIDAGDLGCLVESADQHATHGARLTLVGASARVRRVFDLVQPGGLLHA